MGLYNLVRSKGYKQFMAKLYGWGASVVILGALFKINHYPGADIMLIIGLGTESLIFFFSAFEPLHVEYDWSLVYPELAGMDDIDGKKKKKNLTQELDRMLEEAKIGPELINSLGEGMRHLGENAKKLSGVADAAGATDSYVSNLNMASSSVKNLSETYAKTAEILGKDIYSAEELTNSIKTASASANNLTGAYSQMAETIQKDINATEMYVNSIKQATESAHNLADKYTRSCESLTKSAEAIDFSAVDGKSYGDQIQRMSKNLSDLNNIYELQLKSTGEQLQKTDMMKETITSFLSNLNESVEGTAKYKEQVNVLAKNVSALNQVYGNMLAAMNIKQNN
ncbi:MAG: gliding motility protein GldL [Bacteroidales bacterium]|jgi:gliding motility-associated protein GldL|nr:gliding motility protein GldL [Bacteroidales bacterium]MDD4214592.1 gliding motility protein GldL [Bacteroidales bacterium]